jgi:hypothetical protein
MVAYRRYRWWHTDVKDDSIQTLEIVEKETVEMGVYRHKRLRHTDDIDCGERNSRDGGIQTLQMVAYRR